MDLWHAETLAEANNNSSSSLHFQMNCRAGSPPTTLFKYVITNRKKIFLLLCAFMMGTWIGSSFPYNQLGRHPQMGEHNCADVIPSLSAMSTGSISAIKVAPKPLYSTNSIHSLGMSTNESRSNRTVIKDKGKEWELTYKPTFEVTESRVMSNTSWSNTGNKTLAKEYLVDTPSCKIPNFDPYDISILHTIKKLEPLNCGSQRQLTYVNNGMLIINDRVLELDYGIQDITDVSCCYRTVQRPEGKVVNDNSVEISNTCVQFFNQTPLSSEFVKVECTLLQEPNRTTLTEFHYTVPEKSNVESRCHNASAGRLGHRAFSVMILGMDAISRLNFERHLVKTRRVLLDTLGAVEMLGYNKVGDNTFPNLVPMLTGLSSGGLKKVCWPNKKTPFDACPWLWKDFAAAGYRTLSGEDSTRITSFNYLKPGFWQPPTDYYLRPLLRAAEVAIGRLKELNTYLCLGPRPHHEMTLGWAASFMETFEDRPYFGLLWSNSLTHDDVNFVQKADDFLADMLTDLHSGGRLNNTVLIFVSDHGIRWGELRETLIGRYEERLPALYMSFPAAFRTLYPAHMRNLVANANRLTSPFDLYATLQDVLLLSGGGGGGGGSSETVVPEAGQSLFRPVPLNRTCEEAGINVHWCACQETVALDVHLTESLSLAKFLLRDLNDRTREFRDKCAVFGLSRIVSVLRKAKVQLLEDELEEGFAYVVTVEVTPGGGLFEATIRKWGEEHRRRVEGDISRLNMYGKQSECMEDMELRKMCFCTQKNTEVGQGL